MATLINKDQRPLLVRFVTRLGPSGVSIEREKYTAIFESEHFYYVVLAESVNSRGWRHDMDIKAFEESGKMPKQFCYERLRRVSKTAHATFCYLDEQKAWASFYRRQARRLWLLNRQVSQAQKAMEYMQLPAENADELNLRPAPLPNIVLLGHTDFTRDELTWNEY